MRNQVWQIAEEEGRSKSNMINRLLAEALLARKLVKHDEKWRIKHEGTVT